MSRRLLALLAAPVLLAGCSKGGTPALTPEAAASAPLPGVSLPPGALVDLVPTPAEVPAGMVPILRGSGPRDLAAVASYSGTGTAATQAAAALRAHGFVAAYVAQYANQATGQVLSVVVSQFGTSAGATADFAADVKGTAGTAVTAETLGEASHVTTQAVPGSVHAELVLVRFRRGADTWVLAYEAAPTADPAVAVGLAKRLLSRTAA